MPHYSTLYNAIQYNTIHHNLTTVRDRADDIHHGQVMPCHTTLYNTIQYTITTPQIEIVLMISTMAR